VQILLSTLCDFAADYNGKLSVIGAFDTLGARDFPVIHPQCAYALRMFFDHEDQGTHQFKLKLLGPEDEEVVPACLVPVELHFPPNSSPFVTRNVVLNFQRIKLDRPGLYRFVVEHNGAELQSTPLRVMLFQESSPAGAELS
jgi:hypothetical protein